MPLNKQLFEGSEIIEEGSNTNGEWVKFGSGLMICYNTLTQAVASGATVGFTYTNSETFISKPMYQYTVNSQNGQTLSVNHGMEQNNVTSATIFVQNGHSGTLTIDVNVLAIGRWK